MGFSLGSVASNPMGALFGEAPKVTTDKSGMYALQADARESIRKAIEELNKVDLPDIRRQELQLELPKLVGQLQALEAQDTQLSKVSTDPTYKQAQLQALKELQNRGRVGLTEEDLAKFRQIKRSAEAQNTAQQAAINRQLAQQGVTSSGANLAQKLLASQAAANRGAEQGDVIAATAAQNRLAAIQGASNQAAQMDQTEYNRQAALAQARDAINQFNLTNRQNIANANYQNQQNMANAIVNAKNQQQQYNKQLDQQNFANQMALQGAKAGAYTAQGNMQSQQALSNINKTKTGGSQGWAPLLGTIGGGIAGGVLSKGNPYGVAAGAALGQTAGQMGSQLYQGQQTEEYKDGGIANPSNEFNYSGDISGLKSVLGKENEGNVAPPKYEEGLGEVLKRIISRNQPKEIKAENGYEGLSSELVAKLKQRENQNKAKNTIMPATDPRLEAIAKARGFELGAGTDVQTLAQADKMNADVGMEKASKINNPKELSLDEKMALAKGAGSILSGLTQKRSSFPDIAAPIPGYNPVSIGNSAQVQNLMGEFKAPQFAEGGVAGGGMGAGGYMQMAGSALSLLQGLLGGNKQGPRQEAPMPTYNAVSLGDMPEVQNLMKNSQTPQFEEGGIADYKSEYKTPEYKDGAIVQPVEKAKVNVMNRAGQLADFSTVYGKGVTPAEKRILSTRIKPEYACGGISKGKHYVEGGVQDGHSYVGDRVDAKINSGEMILNLDQQKRLFDKLADKTDKPLVEKSSKDETNQHNKILELDERIADLEKLLTKLAD